MLKASCLCGSLCLELLLPAKWVAHCHCSQCRRAHGAPVVTWVGFRADQVRYQEGSAQPTWHASSEHARRGFCSKCGTPVLFESARWPDEMHVTRASIQEDMRQLPGAHVFYDSHVAWLNIADDLPKVDGATIQAKRSGS